ncbi:MAG: DUF2249 domain-containing protein [Rhodobacterales bacterium]|nr:DUF2249 domain-containing protein [Rhodobacterales bacterium]
MSEPAPDWAAGLEENSLPTVNVTAIGRAADAVDVVLQRLKGLPDGAAVAVIASGDFLVGRQRLMAAGFESHGQRLADGRWRVLVRRGLTCGPDGVDLSPDAGRAAVDEAVIEHRNGVPHLLVGHMDPPGPLVAILTYLERPDCGDTVVAHLSRNPVWLYPELQDRHWSWEQVEGAPNEVCLRLTRNRRGG